MADIPGIPAPDSLNSSSTTPPKPTLQNLLSWTPLYLASSNTDRTLTTLSRILSTPSGTDTLLLLLGYSSLLTSNVLSTISLSRIHALARLTIEKAISLPPNTVILIDGSIPSSKLLVTAQRLKALSAVISDFRIFVRLWGLLGIWRWGKGVWANPPKDAVERGLVKAQVLVNVLFQVLENGAYLSSKGVLGWSPQKQTEAWLWSSRFWMAHVGLEFIRLGRAYTNRDRGTEEQKRRDGPKGDVWTDRGEREWFEGWKRELLVNTAWAPLTLHWSLENGLISDFWVGVFGSVAGIVGTRKAWKAASNA